MAFFESLITKGLGLLVVEIGMMMIFLVSYVGFFKD